MEQARRKVSWPHILAGIIGYALWTTFWHTPRLLIAKVQELKAAKAKNPSQCANRTVKNLPGRPNGDVANDGARQEETPANEPEARDHNKAPGNDKDESGTIL